MIHFCPDEAMAILLAVPFLGPVFRRAKAWFDGVVNSRSNTMSILFALIFGWCLALAITLLANWLEHRR